MISKEDWKIYQEHIGVWQENYMNHLLDEYSSIIKEDSSPSKRFWKLLDKINKDKKHPGVSLTLSKNDAIDQTVVLILDKVITFDDLKDFSDEFQKEVHDRVNSYL